MTELRPTVEQETLFSNNPLAECDPTAFTSLQSEIQAVDVLGYDISVGYTDDEAYDTPAAIADMYRYLSIRDEILAQERQNIIAAGIGSVGINPLKREYRREKRIYERLEPLRDRLLFGENESNSQPWHRQRGRAAALLSITAAHELDTDGTSIYPTMSGPLHRRVLEYHFPISGTDFDGLSLHDAIVKSERQFMGRAPEEANALAERRVAELDEFVHAPVTPQFKKIVRFCSDSLGIRSRKQEVHTAIAAHLEQLVASTDRDMRDVLMMSYGCGTALPMLEVLRDIRDTTGAAPRLLLIDQDPLALAAAATLAEDMDLTENIEIHCQRLFDKLFRPIDIDAVLAGRKLDVVEDSGLREYLPDGVYKRLTGMTWRHLADGGLMSTGNMNINRPQSEFLHGMMGWQPKVQMRHIRDGIALHEAAGIPSGATRARVTRDGVYTLFFSQK